MLTEEQKSLAIQIPIKTEQICLQCGQAHKFTIRPQFAEMLEYAKLANKESPELSLWSKLMALHEYYEMERHPACEELEKLKKQQEENERKNQERVDYNEHFISEMFFKNPYLPINGREKRFGDLAIIPQNAEQIEIIRSWPDHPNFGLFIYGPSGSGKTHAALGLFNGLIDSLTQHEHIRSFDLHWTSPIRILESLRFESDRNSSLNFLENVRFLFIDDLGSESLSEWGLEQLYNVIEVRKNKLRPTIITTNLTPEEVKKKYHERFISRLKESFIFVHLQGQDFRNQILRENTKQVFKSIQQNKGATP